MAEIISMPKLGFDMAEGTLVRWVVQEGEQVSKGGVLAEIETDKATVEVESAYDGVLLRQIVKQGTVVPINDPIAVVGAAGENIDNLVTKQTETAPVAETSQPKPVVADQSIAAAAPVQEQVSPAPAPASGEKIVAQVYSESPHASPLARSMAEDKGIDLRLVKGTGPSGRITKKDIEAYHAPSARVAVQVKAPSAPIGERPIFIRETRTVPLPKLRAAIGRRMSESMQQAPHFYVTHDYDVERLLDMRKEINAMLDEEEKVSVNDLLVRAVALTLLEFPNLNASLDLKNSSLVLHGEINVGVAVAVENGLLTIVNRNTDQKSLRQISAELKTIVKRARDGKVRPDDIEGSTFTISNLGMFDVDQFTAIINPPEAAILAIGSARQEPVVLDGKIIIGTRMRATLSVDHRVSDGAEGARFLQTLAKYIEHPMSLLVL